MSLYWSYRNIGWKISLSTHSDNISVSYLWLLYGYVLCSCSSYIIFPKLLPHAVFLPCVNPVIYRPIPYRYCILYNISYLNPVFLSFTPRIPTPMTLLLNVRSIKYKTKWKYRKTSNWRKGVFWRKNTKWILSAILSELSKENTKRTPWTWT